MPNLLLFAIVFIFTIAVFIKIIKLFLNFFNSSDRGFKVKSKEIAPYIKKKSVFTVAEREIPDLSPPTCLLSVQKDSSVSSFFFDRKENAMTIAA